MKSTKVLITVQKKSSAFYSINWIISKHLKDLEFETEIQNSILCILRDPDQNPMAVNCLHATSCMILGRDVC